MQLPPTILSINDKKKKQSPLAKAKATPNAKKNTKSQTPTPAAPQINDDSDDSANSGAEDALPVATASVSQNTNPKLVPPKTLETTLFDRLEAMYGAGIKRMLEVQYR